MAFNAPIAGVSFVCEGLAKRFEARTAIAALAACAVATGVGRAPLTAIVLVAEMTANLTMLLPMIAACFAAMLVPALFGDESILDSLKKRLLDR